MINQSPNTSLKDPSNQNTLTIIPIPNYKMPTFRRSTVLPYKAPLTEHNLPDQTGKVCDDDKETPHNMKLTRRH